jgi:predicted PurR-regulated permease PerM
VQESTRDLARTTLGVLFLCGLIAAAFWIVRPFLGAVIWATMIVVATWPVMRAIEGRLWGRRGLAVGIMTLILLLVFVVPLTLAIVTVVDHSHDFARWGRAVTQMTLPPPPEWLKSIPMVGGRLEGLWSDLARSRPEDFLGRLTPFAGKAAQWFAAEVGSFGMLVVQFLLTVVIAAIMYAHGESAAQGLRLFARRLAGERGASMVSLAGAAIRGVALGVVVTALVQAVLGGIGLFVTGIPFAAVLMALMFLLCIAQIGPLLVLVPAVAWLFWSGATTLGVVLLVWTVVVGTLDNVLRPWLIKKGADLPLLLIFAGVIGGLLAFGLVGIFVGPVVLAVTYTLLEAWVGEGGAQERAGRGAAGGPDPDAGSQARRSGVDA